MTKRDIVRMFQKKSEGESDCITVSGIATAIGCSERTVRRKLSPAGLNAIDGKYYLINEVAAVYAGSLRTGGEQYIHQ